MTNPYAGLQRSVHHNLENLDVGELSTQSMKVATKSLAKGMS